MNKQEVIDQIKRNVQQSNDSDKRMYAALKKEAENNRRAILENRRTNG